MSRRRTSTDLALIAGFAALIAVCALLPAIKLGANPVPITLQTFGVLLAGAVLGARRGFLAVLLYLVVGLAGLPIFAEGTGGLAVLAKPSAGYLLGFAPAAFLCGFLVERMPRHKVATSIPLIFAAGLVSSAALIHTLGITGLVVRFDLTWSAALAADLPFWPGDVAKNLAMAVVATAVHRAFPDLLPRRATRRQDTPAAAPA
jgi:biotin transport system substrate-specific component